MKFVADLHIHSRYSRATSRNMSPESLWTWAQMKGIRVIGTGDFTHPEWIKELGTKLTPGPEGLFALRKKNRHDDIPSPCREDVSFLLSAEISSIYSKNGKTRKVHSIIFAPDITTAERINASLSKIGNLRSDGRPILGLDAKELLKLVLDASPEAMLIPAHAWTPHFSVFGAASGFNSLEECFDELTPHVHAIETGLSSDPPMNRRISMLDSVFLISNSDAHSPEKIGREATVFDTDITYEKITHAIKTGEGLEGTIEFFPEEGKYHLDGHRNCNVRLEPEETFAQNGLCPVCGKKLTIGVMHRTATLADRKKAVLKKPFRSVIPLPEILSEILQVGVNAKKVKTEYMRLLSELGSEFTILLETPIGGIRSVSSDELATAVEKMRKGDVIIEPGYDGEYGKVKIFGE